MATTTNHAGISVVADYDFVGKFERNLDKLRELFSASDWRRLVPGQTIRSHAIAGTFQAAQTTPGAAVTPSSYADTGTLQPLTFNRWSVLTPVEDVMQYGRDEAILRNDDALLKDIQKSTVAGIMTSISAGATGSALGENFQQAAAAAWAELGTACDNERCTPVFFANYKTASDYLATANVTVQTAFGLTYLSNFMGIATLILDVNVPDDKIWATAAENIIIATADLRGVAEFDMYLEDDGVIAVAHREAMSNGAIATHAWVGIKAFPMFANRFIVASITA